MIDRDAEADDLLRLTMGSHSFRLIGPRRYGKTTLLRRVLAAAEANGTATVLVDLQDVLSISEIVVRLESAYKRLKGPVRRHVEDLLRTWNLGVSLGAAGFTASLRENPNTNPEAVLLRVLEIPEALFERNGTPSLIVFDEIQDVLNVPGADGKIRSVIQHQGRAATYAFAGSAPGMMNRLFSDPSRPLLEQAVPRHLEPLPLNEVADYVITRFQASRRDPGRAMDPLLAFARGHPQRSMMLAHYLWERTPAGETADESTWLAALDQASADTGLLMQAIWRALTLNERRVARALATSSAPLYSDETAALVGIKRTSIRSAVDSLRAKADVVDAQGRLRLTDPMLEHWLRSQGALPDDGDDTD